MRANFGTELSAIDINIKGCEDSTWKLAGKGSRTLLIHVVAKQ